MDNNLEYIDKLAEKSWDTTPKGTPPQGAWNAMNSRLFLQNFMQFSFFHFNIFYAALIVLTIAGTTATVVLSNQDESQNQFKQPTDSLMQHKDDNTRINKTEPEIIHQKTKKAPENRKTENEKIKPKKNNIQIKQEENDNNVPEKNNVKTKQASVNDSTKGKTRKKKVIVVRKKVIVRDTIRKTDTIKKR